ncbi:methyltransferase domain-containing protein [Intrasporangium sp. YIM S08009]|uniref:methyltransferase domain-containing protein n=1 Tax=Intrasporangium zincisolvens TaxID=3080018 RepID=UPI002B05DDFD|nr:methyltransferase domain-containing protein [Intrasporangium sp. YIM S08009]
MTCAGIEARELARNGWRVHTFDADPHSEAGVQEAAHDVTLVEHAVCHLEELTRVPANDLTLACVSLPFLPRESFDIVWRRAVDALQPGGVLAVDLFGDRDGWAGADGTFLTRAEVEHLTDRLDVVSLVEVECDGRSFSGPKHWHTYELVATKARP